MRVVPNLFSWKQASSGGSGTGVIEGSHLESAANVVRARREKSDSRIGTVRRIGVREEPADARSPFRYVRGGMITRSGAEIRILCRRARGASC